MSSLATEILSCSWSWVATSLPAPGKHAPPSVEKMAGDPGSHSETACGGRAAL